MISQDHWDYVDKILADHGVDVGGDGEAARVGRGLGAGVLGWTEATGAPQIEIALAHPIVAAGRRRSVRRRRRPSTRPTSRV